MSDPAHAVLQPGLTCARSHPRTVADVDPNAQGCHPPALPPLHDLLVARNVRHLTYSHAIIAPGEQGSARD